MNHHWVRTLTSHTELHDDGTIRLVPRSGLSPEGLKMLADLQAWVNLDPSLRWDQERAVIAGARRTATNFAPIPVQRVVPISPPSGSTLDFSIEPDQTLTLEEAQRPIFSDGRAYDELPIRCLRGIIGEIDAKLDEAIADAARTLIARRAQPPAA